MANDDQIGSAAACNVSALLSLLQNSEATVADRQEARRG